MTQQPFQPARAAATNLPSAEALLSASAYAKFDTVGDIATGTVVKPPVTRQQTDFVTKEPAFWTDGQPKTEVIISLQGDDPDSPVMDVYVRSGLLTAVKTALVPSGGKCEVGGKLWIQYIGEGEAKSGLNPPKLFKAAYDPPQPAAVTAPAPGPAVAEAPPTTLQGATHNVAAVLGANTVNSEPPF